MENVRKRSSESGSALLGGAAVLGAAAIFSKLLGTLQKIPLQNVAGDEAFGIYNAVFPFYTFLLFLSTAGFPVAVSKFVSEHAASGRDEEARRVLAVASVLMFGMGVAAYAFVFLGAETIAGWMGNSKTAPALRSLSFAFLFVPLMSALRGYFQGWQNMAPTAVSQVAEQTVRVATMLALLFALTRLSFSAEWIAAGAVFGSVTGAAAGLFVMTAYWRRTPRENVPQQPGEPFWSLARRLTAFALPVCLGAVAVPVLNMVDTFTIPRLLREQGMDEGAAMAAFGIYTRGLPLVQLVTMIFSSVSVALIPAFAEARSRGDWHLIRARGEFSIRVTWLVGLAASAGLAFTAVPINIMLYRNDTGSDTMAILAITAIFSIINIVTSSILQGLGHVRAPAVHLAAAAVLKVVLNALWIPVWGVNGAAGAAVAAFGLASVLNMAMVQKRLSIRFRWNAYVWRPFLSLTGMLLVLSLVVHGLQAWIGGGEIPLSRSAYTFIALSAVLSGSAVYLASLFRFGNITREDLDRFPGLRRKIEPFLKAW